MEGTGYAQSQISVILQQKYRKLSLNPKRVWALKVSLLFLKAKSALFHSKAPDWCPRKTCSKAEEKEHLKKNQGLETKCLVGEERGRTGGI